MNREVSQHPVREESAYAMPTNHALTLLGGVSSEKGLTANEVQDHLEESGSNKLASIAAASAWKKLLAQFSDDVVWILIAAAVVSGAMSEWTDTAAILAMGLLLALALTPITVIGLVKLGRQFFGHSNASDSAGESS